MEFDNQDFEQFKELFRNEFGTSATQSDNRLTFLAYINAQQMIVIANRLAEISMTLKSIEEKINK